MGCLPKELRFLTSVTSYLLLNDEEITVERVHDRAERGDFLSALANLRFSPQGEFLVRPLWFLSGSFLHS